MTIARPVIRFQRPAFARPSPGSALPDAWQPWFRRVTPTLNAFAPHHEEAGDWLQGIAPDTRPRPGIDIWPRGHGKSTFAEHGAAYLGETGRRTFCLYVCETQDAADKHVQNVQAILEKIGGPIGQRLENAYGHSRGWSKNMVRTASGFSIVGLGMDTAVRGVKLEDFRPDLIIFDDIDSRHDTKAATKKKTETLTESILPAGSDDCAIWGVQNLVQPNGIFSRIADRRADFLADAHVRGPVKAVRDLVTEDASDPDTGRRFKQIVSGVATWVGCSLAVCQREIKAFGWRAFDREKQNNVKDVEGALWTTGLLNETRVPVAPPLTKVVVSIDPATTSKASSDDTGIGAAGRTADGHGYALADETGTYTPGQWGRRAVALLDRMVSEHGCRGEIVAETNQGGEMVKFVVEAAAKAMHAEGLRPSAAVPFRDVHASKAKRARAEPVVQLYEEHVFHHVGDLPDLEDEQTTWDATDGSESPNRVDWLVWAAFALGLVKSANPSAGYALPI